MHKLAAEAAAEKAIVIQAGLTEAYDKLEAAGAGETHPIMSFLSDWIYEITQTAPWVPEDFWTRMAQYYDMGVTSNETPDG